MRDVPERGKPDTMMIVLSMSDRSSEEKHAKAQPFQAAMFIERGTHEAATGDTMIESMIQKSVPQVQDERCRSSIAIDRTGESGQNGPTFEFRKWPANPIQDARC
jgi:hypothetical protein